MTSPATESAELLQVRRDAGVWFARLNRPDKRNALSDALVAAIGETCERVSADLDARALVLLPDSIRNYMSKFASDDWMRENGFTE